jgi:hypothetical protein
MWIVPTPRHDAGSGGLTAFHFDDPAEALFELEQITLRKVGNRAGHQAEHGPAGGWGLVRRVPCRAN